ncbi:hypothetical protein CPB84DRAFT_1753137 [Gymnopilus junonius]|uniref:DUF6532 domain-containing protein n=1 Tax=Gymnopilus junonius TaxID=109634 RepID=A0A9P5NBM9_GYMJU|nr:hypothetical protein CPB84DRAFT_1753137 [Gymnopilus junonius]
MLPVPQSSTGSMSDTNTSYLTLGSTPVLPSEAPDPQNSARARGTFFALTHYHEKPWFHGNSRHIEQFNTLIDRCIRATNDLAPPGSRLLDPALKRHRAEVVKGSAEYRSDLKNITLAEVEKFYGLGQLSTQEKNKEISLLLQMVEILPGFKIPRFMTDTEAVGRRFQHFFQTINNGMIAFVITSMQWAFDQVKKGTTVRFAHGKYESVYEENLATISAIAVNSLWKDFWALLKSNWLLYAQTVYGFSLSRGNLGHPVQISSPQQDLAGATQNSGVIQSGYTHVPMMGVTVNWL